jgi:hypothetical protein
MKKYVAAMPDKIDYVILNEANQFWNGSSWSNEYPDAELYDQWLRVFKAAKYVFEKNNEKAIYVVANYGMTNQKTMMTLGD